MSLETSNINVTRTLRRSIKEKGRERGRKAVLASRPHEVQGHRPRFVTQPFGGGGRGLSYFECFCYLQDK